MYVERLPSGQWGVYLNNGRRIAIRRSKTQAIRHIRRLRDKGSPE